MKIKIDEIRPLLAQYRVLLTGHPMESFDDTGISYGSRVLDFPDNAKVEPYTTFWSGSGVQLFSIGAFSYTGSTLKPNVSVGRYTSIAHGLKIMGNRHPLERVSTSPVFYTRALMAQTMERDLDQKSNFTPFLYRPDSIEIGNDVWIGEDVTLGHGVKIGDGAVVASHAVVTRDVEPYSVVGGVPAKHIKYRFPVEVCVDIKRTKWWEYAPQVVSQIDLTLPEEFGQKFSKMIEREGYEKFTPAPLTVEVIRGFLEERR